MFDLIVVFAWMPLAYNRVALMSLNCVLTGWYLPNVQKDDFFARLRDR